MKSSLIEGLENRYFKGYTNHSTLKDFERN